MHDRSYFEDVLKLLARWLSPFIPPKPPGRFTLTVTSQKDNATMIVTATLPEKTATDVAKFTLEYSVDGVDAVPIESTGDPITFSAAVGSTVIAMFTETDGSGNESEPSDPVTLLVADVIAPGKPGTFGLAVTGQD